MKKIRFFIGVLAIIPFWGYGQNVNSLLSQWSVVTSGNLVLVNDIQGAAYVGNDITVDHAFNVATSISVPTSTITLAVGGNDDGSGQLQVNAGSAVVGGSVNQTVLMNSGGALSSNDLAGLPPSPVAAIASASQYWSTLTGNSTTSVNAGGQLNFNCSLGSSLAIFNITANQMFGMGYQGFVLNPTNGTSTVLINVSGGNINWNSGNFASEFNTSMWNGQVLFNFYNASNVDLSGLIGGYIVAPDANVMLGNNVDGGIMASNLTVDSEVDLPGSGGNSVWNGVLPVPEPSAASLGAVALAVCYLVRRNLKAASMRAPKRDNFQPNK
jgi:choice-of-anchor A domain-containing protein